MPDGPVIDAYPLAWPIGWPRHPSPARAAFHRFGVGGRRANTIAEGRDQLLRELRLLGAKDVVISTNAPNSRRDNPSDPGAAVYFRLLDKPRVLACDGWNRLADNLVALAKDVEAQRGRIRWRVGSLEQAYAGYLALAAVDAKKPWWQVLGFKDTPIGRMHVSEIEKRWRDLMSKHHPDRGGNPNQAAEINAAWREGKEAMGL
jgi:hypothetical protein